jgi:hypothetical protein
MEMGGWTTAENIVSVIAFLALMIALAISIVKDRLGTAICVTIATVGIGYFNNSVDKSHISKAHLARQISPEVPTHGYKWVGTQTWVLYEDGKLKDVVMYKK